MKCIYCRKVEVEKSPAVCEDCREQNNKFYKFKKDLSELLKKHKIRGMQAVREYEYYGGDYPTIEVDLDGHYHRESGFWP